MCKIHIFFTKICKITKSQLEYLIIKHGKKYLSSKNCDFHVNGSEIYVTIYANISLRKNYFIIFLPFEFNERFSLVKIHKLKFLFHSKDLNLTLIFLRSKLLVDVTRSEIWLEWNVDTVTVQEPKLVDLFNDDQRNLNSDWQVVISKNDWFIMIGKNHQSPIGPVLNQYLCHWHQTVMSLFISLNIL